MLARNLGQSALAKARHALVRRSSAHLICLQHTQASDEDDAGEFRELVRDFAAREIAPHAAEIDRNNSMPSHKNLWTELGHMGLHGRLTCLETCLSCRVSLLLPASSDADVGSVGH